jgi:hypothetical protein
MTHRVSSGWQRSAACVAVAAVVCIAALGAGPGPASAASGTVLCPVVTGSDQTIPFTPHQGWVDVYQPGDSTGRSARVGADARFDLGTIKTPVALIASFDRVEVLPIIVGKWPPKANAYDLSIWGDYICVPPGYPEVWDKDLKMTAKDYFQTFVARSTQIYGVTAFDGVKVIDWGNKINGRFRTGGPDGPIIMFPGYTEGEMMESESAHHTNHEFPYMGWRYGEMPVTPGQTYTINIAGYHSHGGQNYDLETFVRPDHGDGYPDGQCYVGNGGNPVEGDLCMIIAGNSNGQLVEDQLRSEEWDIIQPRRPPVTKWGQTFVAHGVSMAGVVCWANNGSADPVSCTIRIREGGPDGKVISPARIMVGHDCSPGPYVRYPDCPGPLPGYEVYYKWSDKDPAVAFPDKVYQVAYFPDEVKLTPGETYYLDLEFTKPVLMYVDGDYYLHGYGYYNGDKIEHESGMQHGDKRWTLCATIVTYQNPGGKPNR